MRYCCPSACTCSNKLSLFNFLAALWAPNRPPRWVTSEAHRKRLSTGLICSARLGCSSTCRWCVSCCCLSGCLSLAAAQVAGWCCCRIGTTFASVSHHNFCCSLKAQTQPKSSAMTVTQTYELLHWPRSTEHIYLVFRPASSRVVVTFIQPGGGCGGDSGSAITSLKQAVSLQPQTATFTCLLLSGYLSKLIW